MRNPLLTDLPLSTTKRCRDMTKRRQDITRPCGAGRTALLRLPRAPFDPDNEDRRRRRGTRRPKWTTPRSSRRDGRRRRVHHRRGHRGCDHRCRMMLHPQTFRSAQPPPACEPQKCWYSVRSCGFGGRFGCARCEVSCLGSSRGAASRRAMLRRRSGRDGDRIVWTVGGPLGHRPDLRGREERRQSRNGQHRTDDQPVPVRIVAGIG